MVVKVYVSGISGNKEVKKRQQRVLMILDSKHVTYNVVDITEPGKEHEKEFMQQNGNAKDAKYPLPPQIFNEETYCGDYEEFDLANEIDELDKFLKVTINDKTKPPEVKENSESGQVNGHATSSREASAEKEGTTEAPAVEEPSSVPEVVEEAKEETKEEEEKAEVEKESRAEDGTEEEEEEKDE